MDRKSWRIIRGLIAGCVFGILYRNLGLVKYLDISSLETVGIIFINLVKSIVPFLVFFSISSAILSLTEINQAKRIVLLSIICFLAMTIASILSSIAITNAAKPWIGVDKDKIVISEQSKDKYKNITSASNKEITITNIIIDILPGNIIRDFLDGNFIHIIAFASILSVAIIKLNEQQGKIANGIRDMENIMIKITEMIMSASPIVIFCLSFWLIGLQDIAIIKSLGKLLLCLMIINIFVVYVIYTIISIFVLRLNPIHFFKKIFIPQCLGGLLASGASVMPVTMNVCRNRLGISKQTTEFVIPFGATVNMNGSAIYFAAVTIFISKLYCINLNLYQYVVLIILSTISAIGTAPVQGGAMAMISTILITLKIPTHLLVIIIAIDRICDSLRTFTNISGDAFSALFVDKIDNRLNIQMYKADN